MFHIVEDQLPIRNVIQATLDQCGHETLIFSSAIEYLNFIRSPQFTKPFALISDINMPEVDGYTLIGKVSEIMPDFRFIVISGEPHIKSEHKSKACFFLQKPFRFETLVETIEKVLACETSLPSCAHGCGEAGHRRAFGMHNWQCPQGCSTHQNGCDDPEQPNN